MAEHLTCQRPDRHVPKLVCGCPLPCPWHTAIIDTEEPATLTMPVKAIGLRAAARLHQLAADLEKGADDE